MKKYKYRITVESIPQHEANASGESLQFEIGTHEDLFGIIKKLEAREGFTPASACPFGVGLKLFSEIVRENREQSPFTELMPHLGCIMKEIKKTGKDDG